MPANPPAIHTPPSPSPSAPGAVHVVPVAGGSGIMISGAGYAPVEGLVLPAPDFSSKPAWTSTGEDFAALVVGSISFSAVVFYSAAWRVVRVTPGFPFVYDAYAISEGDTPLGLTYEMSMESVGVPPTLTAAGGIPTPPTIVTGAPAAAPATPGAIHAAHTPSPGTPPAIMP